MGGQTLYTAFSTGRMYNAPPPPTTISVCEVQSNALELASRGMEAKT